MSGRVQVELLRSAENLLTSCASSAAQHPGSSHTDSRWHQVNSYPQHPRTASMWWPGPAQMHMANYEGGDPGS